MQGKSLRSLEGLLVLICVKRSMSHQFKSLLSHNKGFTVTSLTLSMTCPKGIFSYLHPGFDLCPEAFFFFLFCREYFVWELEGRKVVLLSNSANLGYLLCFLISA